MLIAELILYVVQLAGLTTALVILLRGGSLVGFGGGALAVAILANLAGQFLSRRSARKRTQAEEEALRTFE